MVGQGRCQMIEYETPVEAVAGTDTVVKASCSIRRDAAVLAGGNGEAPLTDSVPVRLNKLAEDIAWVKMLDTSPDWLPRRVRRSIPQKKGVKYERSVNKRLTNQFGQHYHSGVWFEYKLKSDPYWQTRNIQVDGIIDMIHMNAILLVEVKYRHCLKAWKQLRELYEPVLSKFYESRVPQPIVMGVCEVVKQFDSSVEWPEPLAVVPNVRSAVSSLISTAYKSFTDETAEARIVLQAKPFFLHRYTGRG